MELFQIIWDDENDREGNVKHIAEHGLTIDDVEHVLANPTAEGMSRSTELPVVWGTRPMGSISSSFMNKSVKVPFG